jgi:phosphohistidine phosphatase
MEVYLLRHGIAEDTKPGGSDADRALTSEGKKKLRETLRVAGEAGVKTELILSSHLKRAIQTAEIAGDVLAYKSEIVRSESLNPNSSVEQIWDEIRAHKDLSSIMLVGHNPLLSELAGFLLGCRASQVDFKKGAILRVDFERLRPQPEGVLRWYLTPKLAQSC